MRVLVTGASGFIGSALTRALSEEGFEVLAQVRSPERGVTLKQLGVEVVVGDVLDKGSVKGMVRGVEAVIHLASAPIRGRTEVFRRVKVEGLRNLVEACRGGGLGVFLYVSGVSIYGDREGGEVDETTPLRPTVFFPTLLCECEEILSKARREEGLSVVVLRLGNVYGGGGWFKELVGDLRRGRFMIPSSGENYWGLVHVADVVKACSRTLQKKPLGETLLVVDDEPVKLRDFADFTADLLGVKRPRRVPAFLARLVAGRALIEYVTASVKPSGRRMKEVLGLDLAWPSYRVGVPETLRGMGVLEEGDEPGG